MFLSIRAEAGDSSDRSPWGSFWFEPVPYRSGGPVTADTAMQLTAVFGCVRVLAETVASLPFLLQRESADGSKTQIRDHWLYTLFARRPNAWQNPFEFREMMEGHCALRGNAYARLFGNPGGEVTDMVPIHPARVRVEMMTDTNYRYRIKNADGSETIVNRGAMFHLRGLSSDGMVGLNPIEVARKAVGTGLAAQEYGMRFFDNDARPGGWIEYPGQFKDDDQRRRFRESWQTMQTGENRSKAAVLEYGMKFHEVGITNEDSQFLETRKFSVSDIARLFRIPPHMIGDLEKATFSNIEQQSLEFVIHTLTPWLVRWEKAIESTFLEPDDDLGVEFSTLSLLRGDATARSLYYHNGIIDGWLTRNEARLAENRNPLPGLDEPLRPLNMTEESDAETSTDETLTADPHAPPILPQPTRNRSKTDSRLIALAMASAERIARKESGMVEAALEKKDEAIDRLIRAYAKHADFVATVLSVSRDAASQYCVQQCELIQASGGSLLHEEFFAIAQARLERLALGLLEDKPCAMLS